MKQTHQNEKHAKQNMKKHLQTPYFHGPLASDSPEIDDIPTPPPLCVGFPDRPHPLSNQYPGNVLEVGSPRGEGQGNSWGPVFKEL